MSLDPADKAVVARWAGSSSVATTDDETAIAERITALGTPELAALEILETRIGDYLAEPATQRIDGDGSWDTTTNIAHLERRAEQLTAQIAAAGGTLNATAAALIAARQAPGPITYTVAAPIDHSA